MKYSPKASKSLLVAALIFVAAPACTTVETQSFRVCKNTRVESAKMSTGAEFIDTHQLIAIPECNPVFDPLVSFLGIQ